MAHDAEIGEAYIDFPVRLEHLLQPCQVVLLGAYAVLHHAGALCSVLLCTALDHTAHDDECLVAEHLPQEGNVATGVGSAEVFAVVQYLVTARTVLLLQMSLHHLGRFGVKGVALGHMSQVGLCYE